MRRHAATDLQGPAQERAPCPPLPADHVLGSGAVLFPGAFDQHGCPLVLFPVEGQDKLCSGLSKAEVVEFIHYFQYQHNRKQEKHSLVSAVADLRDASPSTTSFISETLLLLELHKRTVHTVYIVQPRRKDADKLLLKTLAPSKSSNASFKRVLLKEIPELQNYIDRSQLPWSLGGYFMYRHQSWVAFIKEIDAFVQKFLSVVQRLPSCISTLQALSKLPLPTAFSELRQFCATNEAKFQQLRRELGLDELLLHCESVVEKLRYPDREPCYQDMAGTALFTQTAFEMLQNHSRITAAVEKVELLWQQIFLKARLQLQVFQLREDALQITEKIETLLQEKIQPYKVQIAKDATKAAMLVSEFEASIHTPAVALVRWAEDVIHTLAELLPLDSQPTECWALDLERLKEKLDSAVNFILQTLRAVSSYHRYYNKASCWYSLVLSQNFLQELLSGVPGDAASTQLQRKNRGTIPAWRYRLATFLKKNRPPEMEELLYLSHLGHAIPDDEVQRAGKQMSQRCLTLRKLLISSEPLAVGQLQLALQWQYEFLRSGHGNQSSAATHTSMSAPHSPAESNPTQCEGDKDSSHLLGTSPSAAVSRMVSSEDTPPSFSSFDSGFDGAGSSPLEVPAGRERLDGESRLAGTRDFANPALSSPHVHENISPYCEDHIKEFDVGTAGISSRPGVQIIPKADSLNLEIKVKRSAALPNNPWLSLPVDDLENSYTVTITQNPAPQKGDLRFHDSSDAHAAADLTDRCRARPTRREDLSGTDPRGPQSRDWMLRSQTSVEDPELSPVSNVLSSTINEGRDESSCSTEGIPTLLWDSYDLHDQNPLDADGEISLKDWDVKEQEGLKEVKMILDRTDEILEEEENVLAQEAVLDTLLRSEDTQGLWRLCDSEGQFGSMSSDELAEAGVLGFEDCLDSAHPNGLGDLLSAESAGETKAAGGDELHAEAPRVSDVSNGRPDLLTELRKVHMLDELIMEESMKIRELRRSKEKAGAELSGSKPVGVSKEREAFHLQLEEEKREVEKLEKSLEEECKDKKHSAEEVVTCPRTEKVDGALPRSQRLSVLVQSKSENAHKTEGDAQTFSGPDVTRGASPQDLDQLPLPQSQDVGDTAVFDLKEEVGIQTHQSVHEKEWDTSGEGTSLCSPEASLTPEMSLDDGAFDPGGKSLLLPEPEPRKASLPVNYGLAELDAPHSAEVLKSARSSAERDPHFKQFDPQDDALEGQLENVPPDSSRLILNPNVKEHCNNNNNNHVLPENCGASLQPEAKISPENEEAASVEATRSLQPAERIHASPPADEHQLTPAQPLEFDPGGGDERNEKLPDGVQAREALRTPHSGSPGSQSLLYSHRREMSDFESPIVLDTGSGLMKAGFADRDHPNVIFPTIIGVPKYEEVLNGDLEREAYIGHGAQHMRGVLTLRHPIKNGIICNWDEMEQVWHHTFQQLRVEPEDHPVLLTEAAMNPRENRQHMVEIMFERFNVPLAYMAMQAVLALYAAGRTTGVVFDSGDGVSHSVPVFEGYCLPHAVQRFPLAGSDVTLHLKKLLQEQGVCMRTTAEEEIVREMKEECCCVALNYEDELSRGGSSCREMHYTMPDGQIVALSTERFRAPEILFKPELIGRDHDGMHKSIFKSILSSDIDLRRCFLGNIILSGGNTLLPGLPERLQAEIKGLLPADARESVRVTSPTDRDFSVWRGGAVLASLPTMTSAWISQEEYEEYGPQIVFRKCF